MNIITFSNWLTPADAASPVQKQLHPPIPTLRGSATKYPSEAAMRSKRGHGLPLPLIATGTGRRRGRALARNAPALCSARKRDAAD